MSPATPAGRTRERRPVLALGAALLALAAAAGLAAALGDDGPLECHGLACAWGGVFFGFYSKLSRPRILESRNRDTLLRLIQENPGITYTGLRLQLLTRDGSAPIGYGTLSHHLHQLERFGFVTSKFVGRFRRYFDAAIGTQARAASWAMVQDSPAREIVQAVLCRPGLSQTELRNELGVLGPGTRQGLVYQLKRLLQRNLIEVRADGQFRRYWPSEALHQALGFARSVLPRAPTIETAMPATVVHHAVAVTA